jgi:hypothetical protein
MTSILGGSSAAAGLIASSSESIVDPIETAPAPEAPTFLAAPAEPAPESATDAARRLVVRLVGGEELELGEFEDRGDAVEAAHELVGRFSSAEASGEWPEIEGRFLRPASVTSIDVLTKN